MMPVIVLVLLSAAHSEDRFSGNWCITTNFDREDRFVINGTWNVPGPEHVTSAAVQKLGNGWSISYIVTLQSGLPFSILDGAAGTLFGPATTYTTADL